MRGYNILLLVAGSSEGRQCQNVRKLKNIKTILKFKMTNYCQPLPHVMLAHEVNYPTQSVVTNLTDV